MEDYKFLRNNPVFRVKKLDQVQDHSISVIIPCYYKHAYLLKNLVKIYKSQTFYPKEIIISLSGTKHLSERKMKKIKSILNLDLPFNVKIIYHHKDKLPGGNKNSAAEMASGDILVVQDADDIPHRQRLEIIKYFFDRFNIVHLGHGFLNRKKKQKIKHNKYRNSSFNRKIKPNKIFYYRRYAEISEILPRQYRLRITNGEVALKKSIWKKHHWDETLKRAEDTRLNRFLENKYKKSIHLKCRLILYNRVDQI